MTRRIEMLGVWSGPAMGVLTLIGAVLIGRFIPPFVHPSTSAHSVARLYAEHAARIRIGAILSTIGLSLIAPFGVAIAAQTREAEGSRPFLTYLQIASVAVASVFVVIACTFWAITAFRPTQYGDQLVRYSNDVAYFMFIFTWPPFTIWFIAIALAVFGDQRPQPVFPRWSAYLCLWLALLIAAGAMIAFFKTGPFDYAGVFALYVPVSAFFVWVVAMTVVMLRNLNPPTVVPDRQGAR